MPQTVGKPEEPAGLGSRAPGALKKPLIRSFGSHFASSNDSAAHSLRARVPGLLSTFFCGAGGLENLGIEGLGCRGSAFRVTVRSFSQSWPVCVHPESEPQDLNCPVA